MRELSKSVISFSWAMSLFGVQQLGNVVSGGGLGPTHAATAAFGEVTRCTEKQFGGLLRSTFRAADNLQRGLVDLTFTVLTLGAQRPAGRSAGDASAARDPRPFGAPTSSTPLPSSPPSVASTGWGPMPRVDDNGR
jgi:hypothetical protein